MVYIKENGKILCFQSAASTVKYWHWIQQTGLSTFLGTTGQTLHETKTVGEFLFDGYENQLLNFAKKMPMIKIPYDKFGWFYTVSTGMKWETR